MDMQEAAADLRRRGFGIVWLRPGEKRPQRKDWTLASQEPDDYTPGSNLGILTGRLSGDLVCVDLDSAEAIRLADDHLPPTAMVDGRPGKPRSHRWFRVTDIPPEMVSKAAGGIGGPWLKHFAGAGLDFLGTGGQAVVPPSLHPSCAARAWGAPGAEPASVPFQTLWDAVKRLALVCGWKDPAERGRAAVRGIKAVAGQGGHSATFKAAKTLTNDLGIPAKDALPLLTEWNKTNADPPWGDDELLHKLTDAAAQSTPRPERKFNDPYRLAEEFPGVWRWWKAGLYRYDGRRYIAVPDAEVRALLRRHIGESFARVYAWAMQKYQNEKEEKKKAKEAAEESGDEAPKPPKPLKPPSRVPVTEALVNEALNELRAQSLVPGTFNLPCMLPDGTEPHLLAFENGLLDVATEQVAPHTPEWFSTAYVPFRYDPAAVDGVLPKAALVWCGGDEERAALIQEWAGYLLTRSTALQSFMILTGDGGNGKSAFTAALEAMLGPDNLSYLPWESLGGRFDLIATLGKLLNVSDDIGEFDRSAEGTLKWVTGGKPVKFEDKGKPVFFTRMTARLMLCCNQVPRIADRTEGVWRRALVLPFDGKIAEGEKVFGMDKAEWWAANANLPGILNWALAGLRRLRENGNRFTRPKRSEEAKQQLRLESNPALIFLGDNVVAHAGGRDISSADLYTKYRDWSATNGHKPLANVGFAKEVQRKFPGAESKSRKVGGKVARYWHGVRLFDGEFRTGIMTWAQMYDLMQRAIDEGRSIQVDTSTGECIDRETEERLDWWPFPPAPKASLSLPEGVAGN